VLAAGARPLRPRRLQRDALFDADNGALKARGCALRVRLDDDTAVLTFKGTVQPGAMKTREEHETTVSDAEALERVLDGLGFHVWFRYEKYREEFSLPGVTIAVDETPVGTFVEVEGDESAIIATTAALGRSESDFILQSYRGLFAERGKSAGLTGPDMVFPR
jgi:adenylate cyclase class 2